MYIFELPSIGNSAVKKYWHLRPKFVLSDDLIVLKFYNLCIYRDRQVAALSIVYIPVSDSFFFLSNFNVVVVSIRIHKQLVLAKNQKIQLSGRSDCWRLRIANQRHWRCYLKPANLRCREDARPYAQPCGALSSEFSFVYGLLSRRHRLRFRILKDWLTSDSYFSKFPSSTARGWNQTTPGDYGETNLQKVRRPVCFFLPYKLTNLKRSAAVSHAAYNMTDDHSFFCD